MYQLPMKFSPFSCQTTLRYVDVVLINSFFDLLQ